MGVFRLFRYTMSGEKVYEGVFAVHKPQGVTSADVLRKLQTHFNPSQLFAPWLETERARRRRESNFQRKRRRTQRLEIKIGHGGTLDPLATGVLVAGVGKGTKHLNQFLGCKKTYEAVFLFGAETDTYDRLGKILRRAPYEHIKREKVEEALNRFRGEIMQDPPIFSALRVQGKKLYEYARRGLPPPVEIPARPVKVFDLDILEWYDPGSHRYEWPKEEISADEVGAAEKQFVEDSLRDSDSRLVAAPFADGAKVVATDENTMPLKRKTTMSDGETSLSEPSPKKAKATTEEAGTPIDRPSSLPSAHISGRENKEPETAPSEEPQQQRFAQPPAVKLTMTVSSGFYVRSLAHDLGIALGSCGLMSELVRTRQGDFDLEPDNILEYKDLEAGEEVWGPKVKRFLVEWAEKREALWKEKMDEAKETSQADEAEAGGLQERAAPEAKKSQDEFNKPETKQS